MVIMYSTISINSIFIEHISATKPSLRKQPGREQQLTVRLSFLQQQNYLLNFLSKSH